MNNNTKDLTTIITDYKTISQTINYIKELYKSVDYLFDTIVVDNSLNFNSKIKFDKAFEYIKSTRISDWNCYQYKFENSWIILVYSNKNNGYAGGNNIGANIANKLFEPQYLLFSNSDIELNKGFSIKKNIQFLKNHPSIGILGPTIKDLNGKDQNPRKQMSAKSQLIYWYFDLMWFHMKFNQWNLDKNAHSKKAFWVSGSFMFVRNKAFIECNGFDEHNFLYGEEIILSSRMRQKKYSTYYLEQIPIIHAHQGGTNSTFKNRRQNHKSIKYYYRKYENTPRYILVISDLSFYLVELVSYLKHHI